MTRRVYVYFVLTFLLGVIVGGAATVFYAWNWGHWRRPFNKERLVQQMTRELDLSEPQVRQLREILEETLQKYQALQRQVRPQFTAIREESHQRVRAILTPEQVVKFEERLKRLERRRLGRHPDP